MNSREERHPAPFYQSDSTSILKAVKVMVRDVMQHKAQDVFTTVQLMFSSWASQMSLCSLFMSPNHPGAVKHEMILINQPQMPSLVHG